MSTALRPDLVSIPTLFSRDVAPQASAPVLNYHTSTAFNDRFLFKTLAGFAIGSLLTGVMLSFAAVAGRSLFQTVPHATQEFCTRSTFLFGLSFVGSSLLLATLKAREERAGALLHARHWIVSIATGAGYALAVFGPGLAAEGAFPVNRYAQTLVWMMLLLYPTFSSYWMLARQDSDWRPAPAAQPVFAFPAAGFRR